MIYMDTKKLGKCINFGNCSKADRNEIIELEVTEDFLCPECNCDLLEEKQKKNGASKKGLLIGLLATIIVISGGIVAFFLLKDKKSVESISFYQQELSLEKGSSQPAMLRIVPQDMENIPLTWSSDDESVAVVDNGTVTGLKEGKTFVRVSTDNKLEASLNVVVYTINKNKEDSLLQVNEEPEIIDSTEFTQGKSQGTIVDPETSPNGGLTSGTVAVRGGKYTGEMKNGKAHGMGTVKYTSHTRISNRDRKERYANAGEYITGEFYNGELVQGELYDTDNQPKERLVLGRPN